MSFETRCAAMEFALEVDTALGWADLLARADAIHDFLVADEPDEDEYVEDEYVDGEIYDEEDNVCDFAMSASSVTIINVQGDYFEGDIHEPCE